MATINFGGMPTALDVERLCEALGTLHKGDIVTYEQMEEVLKVSHKQTRFQSIALAYRRKMYRDHNLRLKAIPNTGYEVLSNSKRVSEVVRLYTHKIRDLGRIAIESERINRSELTTEEQRNADHVGKMAAHFRLAASTAARELEPPETKVRPLIAQHS